MASTKTRSFSEAAEASGLPTRVKMAQLAALGRVTYLSAVGGTAALPETGEQTEGFVVTVRDGKDKLYTCFIGATILVDTLARIEFPFTASLVKSGRAWTFAD